MSDHHPLSPSAWSRWSTCPGSRDAEKGLPETRSEAAEEGSTAHEVLELSFLVSEYPSRCWRSIPGAVEEMGTALDLVYAGVALALELGRPQAYIEQRLTLRGPGGEALLYGTGDLVLVYPHTRTLAVIDLKYGTKHVRADSGQLKIYALAAADTLIDWEPTRISTTILQPRDGGRPVRTAHHTPEAMQAFRGEVYAAIAATEELDPPRVPGAHCYFCRAHETCEERRRQSIEADFAGL